MTRLLVAALAWVGSHVSPSHVGRGTVFDHPSRDKHNVGGHACDFPRRRAGQSTASKLLEQRGLLIAHRTLPCWAVVAVCSLSSMSCSLATVADRGPARALVDLWHLLAEALGHIDGPVLLLWSEQRRVS